MIIQISDIRSDETIEIRVKDSLILKRPAESVDIHIHSTTKRSVDTTLKRPDVRPRHRCRSACKNDPLSGVIGVQN